MDRLLRNLFQEPVLLVIILVALVMWIRCLFNAIRAHQIGKVKCNRCGHMGNLGIDFIGRIVCAQWKSDDWRKI